VLGDHKWEVQAEGRYRGRGSASVHVRVDQVELTSLEEPSEFPGEGDAEAPLDQPVKQRPNRYT